MRRPALSRILRIIWALFAVKKWRSGPFPSAAVILQELVHNAA
jgi:hypothetical protein